MREFADDEARGCGCVTTADASRPRPRLSHSPPTSLFSPTVHFLLHPFSLLSCFNSPSLLPCWALIEKGRDRQPLCNVAYHVSEGKKTKKPASPGAKKQAPPKGSLVIRLSRQPEYLIVLGCPERQESALAPVFV